MCARAPQVTAAYQTLSDPTKRAQYNLSTGARKCPRPSSAPSSTATAASAAARASQMNKMYERLQRRIRAGRHPQHKRFTTMKVMELKSELSRRGLATFGCKDDLLDRLLEFVEKKGSSGGTSSNSKGSTASNAPGAPAKLKVRTKCPLCGQSMDVRYDAVNAGKDAEVVCAGKGCGALPSPLPALLMCLMAPSSCSTAATAQARNSRSSCRTPTQRAATPTRSPSHQQQQQVPRASRRAAVRERVRSHHSLGTRSRDASTCTKCFDDIKCGHVSDRGGGACPIEGSGMASTCTTFFNDIKKRMASMHVCV